MTDKPQAKPQIDKFKEAAREHETDDDESRFNERLKRIAKSPTKDKSGDKPKDGSVHDRSKNCGD